MDIITTVINADYKDYLMLLAVAVLGYFIGNINFALIISKLKKRDIRKEDSGNPGAMNMLRNYGTFFGAMTLLLDALKGAGAALLGWLILSNLSIFGDIGKYIGGVSAIIGHIYPVFLKFKGGKGIASSIGVCFVLNPPVALCSFIIGAIFIIITKMGALTSFIIIGFPLAFKCLDVSQNLNGFGKNVALCAMILMFLLTLWAHRKNLKNMFLGTERKTSIFSKYKSAQKK